MSECITREWIEDNILFEQEHIARQKLQAVWPNFDIEQRGGDWVVFIPDTQTILAVVGPEEIR